MISDEHPGVELNHGQAWELLQSCHFGRLAISVLNEPDVFPLNYLADEGKIWIRTNPGTKLAGLSINTSVALEADELSDDEAWSVVVKGTARILESQTEIDVANRLPLSPWSQTRKWTYVEITPTSVSGRRFVLGQEPERY
jgi:nitroimidazol reductase NimA-like FMN-containing flavoprotein (pyridoxamine 5'-phosphate oxidase superfamily)